MRISRHPFWQVGFRPFFALACVSGLGLPLLWAAIYSGTLTLPAAPFHMVQWHAHEMFFGFGWAVLGGFLLTATKNWVKVRGYYGGALMFLAAAWLFERIGMWFGGGWPTLLFRVSNNLFLAAITVMVLWTLIRYRKNDSYEDNYFFLIIVPMFLLAKNLMLSAEYMQTGWSMALGLFRVAILLMLERTVTGFMLGAFQVSILRNSILDRSVKLLALVLVFESMLPAALSGGIALLLAVLLLVRFIFWKPQLAMQRVDIGIMYLGYLAIIIQLLIYCGIQFGYSPWIGAISVHMFTFGAMGLIIPAMLIRISNGHTGRKIVFGRSDNFVLWVMIFALLVRIVMPQLYPGSYAQWIYLAVCCWLICYGILGWRYIPFLLAPRLDGREH